MFRHKKREPGKTASTKVSGLIVLEQQSPPPIQQNRKYFAPRLGVAPAVHGVQNSDKPRWFKWFTDLRGIEIALVKLDCHSRLQPPRVYVGDKRNACTSCVTSSAADEMKGLERRIYF